MNILFVASHFPYPPNDGTKIPSFHVIRQLAREHRIALLSLIDSDDEEYLDEMRGYCDTLEVFRRRPRYSPVNFIRALRYSHPYHIAYSYHAGLRRRIDQLLAEQHFDLLQSQFYWVNESLPRHRPIPSVLHMWSIESLTLDRYLQFETNPIKKILAREEMSRIRSYEDYVCRKFDLYVMISKRDEEVVRQRYPGIKTLVMSNGVDTDYFQADLNGCEGDSAEPAVVFVGAMNYLPNIDAVAFFVREIWPHIVRDVPGAKFYVVGKNPVKKIQAMHNTDSIIVTGEVKDIRPYLRRASVSVLPLRSGSGIKNKLLEAWAMGAPVVSTAIGAEGIEIAPGRNILIADEPVDFGNQVVSLLKSPRLQKELGRAGSETIQRNYSWHSLVGRLQEAYQELLREASA